MSWDKTRFTAQAAVITPATTDLGTAVTGRCPSGTHSLWIQLAGDVEFSLVLDPSTYHVRTYPQGETGAVRFHHIRDTLTTASGIQANFDPDL